ncbi:MAG TPA: hypothetical protein PK225_03595 [Azonexus sp.]|nr:hypothetical protein [Azonexus sp.]
MTIHPRHYADFDPYADAVAHEATNLLPQTSPYDSYEQNHAKRNAIRAALDEAEEVARDKWERYLDDMQDLYERGVGPAWD